MSDHDDAAKKLADRIETDVGESLTGGITLEEQQQRNKEAWDEAYRLGLQKEVDRILQASLMSEFNKLPDGGPMSNSRGTSADWAGATVVLQEGKRIGWKILRGAVDTTPNSKYYAGYRPNECEVLTKVFKDPGAFEEGKAWCASFEGHERETGIQPMKGCNK